MRSSRTSVHERRRASRSMGRLDGRLHTGISALTLTRDPIDRRVELVRLREDGAERRRLVDDRGSARAREEGDRETGLFFAQTSCDVDTEAVAQIEVE